MAITFTQSSCQEDNISADLTVTVLLVEQGQYPKEITIPNMYNYPVSAENTIKDFVGGNIETITSETLSQNGVQIFCNDSGKINGLPLNRAVFGDRYVDTNTQYISHMNVIDIIAGSFVVVGQNIKQNGGGLNDEQLKKYTKEFYHPQIFGYDRKKEFTIWNEIEPFVTTDIDSLPLIGIVKGNEEYPHARKIQIHETITDPSQGNEITRVLVSQNRTWGKGPYSAVWRNIELDDDNDFSFNMYGRQVKLNEIQWEKDKKHEEPCH